MPNSPSHLLQLLHLYEDIGQNIKYLRRFKKLSQEELAERTGVSVEFINAVETQVEPFDPAIGFLFIASRVLDVSMGFLLTTRQEADAQAAELKKAIHMLKEGASIADVTAATPRLNPNIIPTMKEKLDVLCEHDVSDHNTQN